MGFIIFSQNGVKIDNNTGTIVFGLAVKYEGKKPAIEGPHYELIPKEKVDALFGDIIDQLSMGGGLTEDECTRIVRKLKSSLTQISS